jgi:hypothetical protein
MAILVILWGEATQKRAQGRIWGHTRMKKQKTPPFSSGDVAFCHTIFWCLLVLFLKKTCFLHKGASLF